MLDSYQFHTLWTQYHHHSPDDPFSLSEAIKIIATYTLEESRDIVDRTDGSRGKALHPALLDLLDSALPALQELISIASRRRWSSKVYIVDPCDMNMDALRRGYTFANMSAIWAGFVRRILNAEERFKQLCFPETTHQTAPVSHTSQTKVQHGLRSSSETMSSTCHVTSHALPPSSTNCLVQLATTSATHFETIKTNGHWTDEGITVQGSAEKTAGNVVEGSDSVVEDNTVRSNFSTYHSSLMERVHPAQSRPFASFEYAQDMPVAVKPSPGLPTTPIARSSVFSSTASHMDSTQTASHTQPCPSARLDATTGVTGAVKSPPGIAPAAVAVSLTSAGVFARTESPSMLPIHVAGCQDSVLELLECQMHHGRSPTPAETGDTSAKSDIRPVPGKDPPVHPIPSASFESVRDTTGALKSLSPSGLAPVAIAGPLTSAGCSARKESPPMPPRLVTTCEDAVPDLSAYPMHRGLSPALAKRSTKLHAEDLSTSNNTRLVPRTNPPIRPSFTAPLDYERHMTSGSKSPPPFRSSSGLPSMPIARSLAAPYTSSGAKFSAAPSSAATYCDGVDIHQPVGISTPSSTCSLSGHATLSTSGSLVLLNSSSSSVEALEAAPSIQRRPLTLLDFALDAPDAVKSLPETLSRVPPMPSTPLRPADPTRPSKTSHLHSPVLLLPPSPILTGAESPPTQRSLGPMSLSPSSACSVPSTGTIVDDWSKTGIVGVVAALSRPTPVSPVQQSPPATSRIILGGLITRDGPPSMPPKLPELPDPPDRAKPALLTPLTSTPSERHFTPISHSLAIPSAPSCMGLNCIASADSSAVMAREDRSIVETNNKNLVLSSLPRSPAPARRRPTTPMLPESTSLRLVCVAHVPALLWCSWEADVKRDAHGIPERLARPWPESIAFSRSLSPPLPSSAGVEHCPLKHVLSQTLAHSSSPPPEVDFQPNLSHLLAPSLLIPPSSDRTPINQSSLVSGTPSQVELVLISPLAVAGCDDAEVHVHDAIPRSLSTTGSFMQGELSPAHSLGATTLQEVDTFTNGNVKLTLRTASSGNRFAPASPESTQASPRVSRLASSSFISTLTTTDHFDSDTLCGARTLPLVNRAAASPKSVLSPPLVSPLLSTLLDPPQNRGVSHSTVLVPVPPLVPVDSDPPPIGRSSVIMNSFTSIPPPSTPSFLLAETIVCDRQKLLPGTSRIIYSGSITHDILPSMAPKLPRPPDYPDWNKSATSTPPHDIYFSSTIARSLTASRTPSHLDFLPARPSAGPHHGAAVRTANAALPWCSWEADIKRDAHGFPERLVCPRPRSSFLISFTLPPSPLPSRTGTECDPLQHTQWQRLPQPTSLPPSQLLPGFAFTPTNRSFVGFNTSNGGESNATLQLVPANRDCTKIGLPGRVCTRHSLSNHNTPSVSALPRHRTRTDSAWNIIDEVKTSQELSPTLANRSLVIFNAPSQALFPPTPPGSPPSCFAHMERHPHQHDLSPAFTPLISIPGEHNFTPRPHSMVMSTPPNHLELRANGGVASADGGAPMAMEDREMNDKNHVLLLPPTSQAPALRPTPLVPLGPSSRLDPLHISSAVRSLTPFLSPPGLLSTPITRSVMDFNTSSEGELGATLHLAPTNRNRTGIGSPREVYALSSTRLLSMYDTSSTSVSRNPFDSSADVSAFVEVAPSVQRRLPTSLISTPMPLSPNTSGQTDFTQTAPLAVAPCHAVAVQAHTAVPGALDDPIHARFVSAPATNSNSSGQAILRTAHCAIELSISAFVLSNVRTPPSVRHHAVASPESTALPPQEFRLTPCILHSSSAAEKHSMTPLASLSFITCRPFAHLDTSLKTSPELSSTTSKRSFVVSPLAIAGYDTATVCAHGAVSGTLLATPIHAGLSPVPATSPMMLLAEELFAGGVISLTLTMIPPVPLRPFEPLDSIRGMHGAVRPLLPILTPPKLPSTPITRSLAVPNTSSGAKFGAAPSFASIYCDGVEIRLPGGIHMPCQFPNWIGGLALWAHG